MDNFACAGDIISKGREDDTAQTSADDFDAFVCNESGGWSCGMVWKRGVRGGGERRGRRGGERCWRE